VTQEEINDVMWKSLPDWRKEQLAAERADGGYPDCPVDCRTCKIECFLDKGAV